MAETKTLHLTLKKKWFDMIASGEKKEEYRELKPYWVERLLNLTGPVESLRERQVDKHNIAYDLRVHPVEKVLTSYWAEPKQFEKIVFKNGYNKTSPVMEVEFKGLEIREGKSEWGFGGRCFVIKLGEVVNG